MKIQTNQYLSPLQIQDQYLNTGTAQRNDNKVNGSSFQNILDSKLNTGREELKFSKHAALRLTDRNIELSGEQLKRLTDGTQKAGAKGIQESLVLVDQMAFIVNIQNKTVITAMDATEATNNVFTNIDGAVIA